jgi:hypothetical protein
MGVHGSVSGWLLALLINDDLVLPPVGCVSLSWCVDVCVSSRKWSCSHIERMQPGDYAEPQSSLRPPLPALATVACLCAGEHWLSVWHSSGVWKTDYRSCRELTSCGCFTASLLQSLLWCTRRWVWVHTNDLEQTQDRAMTVAQQSTLEVPILKVSFPFWNNISRFVEKLKR